MKKKVLVTGASGFIGQFFINNAHEFDIIKADLKQQSVDQIDFRDVDVILHLAAYVHQMEGGNEELYYNINRDLAYQVAKRAKENGVHQFILMSTVKVYGEYTDNNSKWNERSECNPQDDYGKSKLEAESLISKLVDNQFNVAILRSPIVYGPGVKANMFNLLKLIDRFPIIPLGGINNKRSMVYVGNLTEIIKKIINREASGVFIPLDNRPVSTTDLVKLITRCLNKRVLMLNMTFMIRLLEIFKPKVKKRLLYSLELDDVQTKKLLNFEPPYSVEQGICEMIDWYKNKL